jgi:hypothetical protein
MEDPKHMAMVSKTPKRLDAEVILSSRFRKMSG